ncbi:MAG: hypothetical protein KGI10_02065 [Thaumarchaeota archaeon]|nr:hypothetical protein [Nitrososphaerota archaeon]
MSIQEGKNGRITTKINQSRIKQSSIKKDPSQDKIHDLQILSQKVADVFAKAEQDNDEMIIKMRNVAMDKTTSSIIQAEKSNDTKLEEMINALPKHESHILSDPPYNLNELSSELTLLLK